MDPIFLLNELSLLNGITTALDVGTKDGKISKRLSAEGVTVDAIDINDLPSPIPNIHFEKISVANFIVKNSKKYDLVIARHVLHHLPDPKHIILELSNISKVLFFTCFGPKDDWFGKVSTLTQEEVVELFPTESIIHRSEAFQYGKTYSGETKFWHINTFIIKN